MVGLDLLADGLTQDENRGLFCLIRLRLVTLLQLIIATQFTKIVELGGLATTKALKPCHGLMVLVRLIGPSTRRSHLTEFVISKVTFSFLFLLFGASLLIHDIIGIFIFHLNLRLSDSPSKHTFQRLIPRSV